MRVAYLRLRLSTHFYRQNKLDYNEICYLQKLIGRNYLMFPK